MKTQVMVVAALMSILAICGCNSYKVRPLPYDAALKEVVVVDNPRVIVSDFKGNLEEEFNSRGIRVRTVPATYAAKPEEYTLHYTALQSWDFVRYLSDAEVRIYKDGLIVGRGHYHHIGQSVSLDVFTKWRGTEWKMADLYDELLENYGTR